MLCDIKISILLPCYNGERFLEQAINSVLNQDYKNWELIIIDGKSTDNSHEIISKYLSDERINWFKYNDRGISDALNYALDFVQGGVIGYLGSDDYYDKNVFSKLAKFLDSKEKFYWIYGNSYNFYINKNYKVFIKPGRFLYNALFLGNFVGLQNCFFNSGVLTKYKFDETNRYSMDYELWFRLFKEYKPQYINEVISYNIQSDNISSGILSKKQSMEAYGVAKKNARTIFQKLLVLSRNIPIIGSAIIRIYKLFLAI